MILKIQLLGLFISWFVIMMYYLKEKNFTKKGNNFRGILIVNYLIQLLYLASSIATNNQSGEQIYGKLYWICIIIYFLLLSKYIFDFISGKKYQNQDTVLERQNRFSLDIFFIAIGISALAVFFLLNPVIQDDMLVYKSNIAIFCLFPYIIFNFIILLVNQKKLDSRSFSYLFMTAFLEIIIVGLQYFFEGFTILNAGTLFITLYLFFELENPILKNMEILQLERDQALHQSIDKSSFLKTLSHEIRTPLNTIDGFSQVIMDTDDINEIKDDVRDIRIASKDLIDTINGMIDLSIIETGELQIIPENYNVYDMIENITELIQSKLKDEQVEFIVNIEENIPAVLLGDSERISQMILNLLKNSIKYTEQGKIELIVSSVKSASICRLKIVVKDTGKGMNEEELLHLFDSVEDKQGYHLGLQVTKYLTELMNGKLDVESKETKGSTFTITLDQKIISETAINGEKKKKIIKPFKAADKRILIVDDNKLNLKVASKLLSPYLVQVIEANSGQECLDILEKDTNFDLILMDDLMPSMSGTQTLDIIKKIQRVDGYYIPVVVLTANAISGMKEQYINVGFEDYLSKPIAKEELDRILKKYLKKSTKNDK